MAKYRRISSEVDAVQFTRDRWKELQELDENAELTTEDFLILRVKHNGRNGFQIHTGSDWRSVKQENYLVLKKPNDIAVMAKTSFESLYESLEMAQEDEDEDAQEAKEPVPNPSKVEGAPKTAAQVLASLTPGNKKDGGQDE